MKLDDVDEKIGVWFVYGRYSSGKVDISNGVNDIFTHIPQDVANELCKMQEEFRNRVYNVIDKL